MVEVAAVVVIVVVDDVVVFKVTDLRRSSHPLEPIVPVVVSSVRLGPHQQLHVDKYMAHGRHVVRSLYSRLPSARSF